MIEGKEKIFGASLGTWNVATYVCESIKWLLLQYICTLYTNNSREGFKTCTRNNNNNNNNMTYISSLDTF
jgi:hypothetical protein